MKKCCTSLQIVIFVFCYWGFPRAAAALSGILFEWVMLQGLSKASNPIWTIELPGYYKGYL